MQIQGRPGREGTCGVNGSVSPSRDDEDMPLMKDTLGHWSLTQIIREGTRWEHRASTVSPNTYVGK